MEGGFYMFLWSFLVELKLFCSKIPSKTMCFVVDSIAVLFANLR